MGGDQGAFVASLCRCRTWQSSGGKSNAYFAKTRDDRFVVKQMSKVEKQSFLDFAPAYFRCMPAMSPQNQLPHDTVVLSLLMNFPYPLEYVAAREYSYAECAQLD